ncbi:flavin monoamine oxidase family protein [Aporhodopirellula aestuarii]|uniref:NAD(P)/FAD-dependent oxidoreductase n=1 Tax=Aporhodopirellula aestuarii TaxID=2950107 RepID=A0ABT0U5D3_9BACT|nr:NAD(P)/FAD-dependent oxidoreductase [Aporhodopirellula aestuarii]MCM2372136.1 NAD(P)/FAD-dependent oxidoreductase [Aporhodopirellula aestuarii]
MSDLGRESPLQSDGAPRRERLRHSRRELIEMIFGPAALAAFVASGVGCDQLDRMFSKPLPPLGDLLSPNHSLGHRLRESPATRATPGTPSEHCRCVIVGGGVAGLSAARHLIQRGINDFIVLELETFPGGTSRSGEYEGHRFPWGAHYLPVPLPENRPLVEFLVECGVLEPTGGDSFVASEGDLCRDPEERVFASGQWYEGLYPAAVATQADLQALDRFRSEMTRLASLRGSDGRRLFAIPSGESSSDASARELDQISMADWLRQNKFDSQPLRWLIEYACRDDYGLRADQTSAWAGLFYFVARIADASGESQPVMTWPEGNGFLVDQLCKPLGERLRLGNAVMRISLAGPTADHTGLLLDVIDSKTDASTTIQADHVIVAVPQFIAKRILAPELIERRAMESGPNTDVFSYGSWLVANVHVSDRPAETGFPMSWDNVIMSSGSLGYVNSLHQTGRDHGPTVLTWYQALPDDLPAEIRAKLLKLGWAEAAETVIADLELAHPDIRGLITRLDVMVWGHAMPQPRVGTIFHSARGAAAKPIGNVHFACTDLSGMALFEEAFAHGRRAAMEVAGISDEGRGAISPERSDDVNP